MAEFDKVPYSGKDLGVFLLESIATGLYKNRLNIIREYAQNETDTGVADIVKVVIKGKDLLVTGNGAGMDYDEVMEAKRIGFPSKDPTSGPEAGFRHIGLWCGVSACETLYVTTKKERAKNSYMLKIDAAGLREEIETRSQKPLPDVLAEHVFVKEVDVPESDRWRRGTSVRLANVTDDYAELLTKQRIIDYLARTAPVDFHKDFEHRELITEMLEANVPGYKTFNFLVDDTPVFKPPFVKEGVLGPPDPFKLTAGKRHRAYAWVCHNREPHELEGELNWGLVYKWKGWTVGDAYTIQNLLTTEANRVKWMVGEVYVLDIGSIRPNTEKDNFEPSEATGDLETWLSTTVWNDLRRNVHVTSATSKAVERVQEATEITKEIPGLDNEAAWRDHLYAIQSLMKSLERDHKTKAVLERVKPKIERAVKRLRAHLKKAEKAFDEWKKGRVKESKAQAGPGKEPANSETEKAEEEKGEAEGETAGPTDVLAQLAPKIEKLARRAKLGPEGAMVLNACVRVLAKRSANPSETVSEFLALLDLELGAGE